MFALTPRLMLRPGWPEDAPALAEAIAYEQVVRMTSRVPWPYMLRDAESFLARAHDHRFPACLVFERGPAAPRLIGGVGLHPLEDAHEIGYWLTPAAWGRGFATEAAAAMIDHARHGLGISHILGRHFGDNPASGRVLRKVGFEPTGSIALLSSVARAGEDPAVQYVLALRARALSVAA